MIQRISFKCKLLSDVILNQKASSEGPNTTLDFIPGSSILGIAAASIYDDESISQETKWTLFHSGKVRFGDAHPSKDSIRALRVPASVFYPKMKSVTEEAYIHHLVKDLSAQEIREKQLKQCRAGFYTFTENEAKKIDAENSYAIKSAHDKDARTSKESQMYGYQSLGAGLDMLFTVEIEDGDDNIVALIEKVLIGKKRVGRSRSAQYGLIEIEKADVSTTISCSTSQDNIVTVYADGRLIFLNKDGVPTLQPEADDLGIADGKILWDKSQIRTFCYAPYNYKRRCFDTDRCGIEKGSVFVIETSDKKDGSSYVGSYNNEGFGAVIYNPAFLDGMADGHAKVKFSPANDDAKITPCEAPDTVLARFVTKKGNDIKATSEAYDLTKEWKAQNEKKFRGERFASQWGSIRKIAMTCKTKDELYTAVNKYLGHGIASDTWKKSDRKVVLLDFIKKLNDQNARITVVNLAAEMGKLCANR